ncbi:hypothetical protein [Bradyrhizobium erythrophlei]|uniref:Uncharacterized protein n=1 Tax=Bradyrhizobium erythrophlei TaxID=1437360 RepID=A0A1M5NM61_9BRAD|nr:hypothetical protein [Bradyrhizobium erythrophlei]SHG90620.1 hypothetical protein SAMN05443248_3049 [Bradyrhizobium erythrophlei]
MLKTYYAATLYPAGQFVAGMSAADAEALCAAISSGRDPSKSAVCFYNAASIYVIQSGQAPVQVPVNNWIVAMPDGTISVHADADFKASFVAQ